MTPARKLLLEFVLERSSAEPIAKRIKLYRALAGDFTEADLEFKLLTGLADTLEEAEGAHDQMLLNLREGVRSSES